MTVENSTAIGQQSGMTQLQLKQAHAHQEVWLQTAKGKGMVVARPSTLALKTSNPSSLPESSALEAQYGARDGDYSARFPAEVCAGWLPPVHMDHPTQGYKALQAMRSSQPCLIRKSPLVTGLANRWTPSHLEAQVQAPEVLEVLCSAVGRCRFMQYRDSSNVFGSHYHVREPETQRLQMDFQGFAQCAQQWQQRQLFLQETILERVACSAVDTLQLALRDQLRHTAGLGRALQEEMTGRVDWAWLHSLLHAQKHGGVARVQLQMGPPNGLLPARYQALDRLLAQVNGRRRVLLLPPSQAFRGLYPFPVHHPYDGYSMVDFDRPDESRWPAFADGVRGTCCILQPGDLLFVPQYWFAHSQMLDNDNADLVFDLLPGSRVRHVDTIPLQISRLLEERVAAAEGVAHVRHWLSLIGEDTEEGYVDPETLKGYRRIVMCEAVRDEVAANLGPAASATAVCNLLADMTSERLLPTPWLNQNFREPLYLTDRSVRIADNRTEEERKYPQLFRQKLEGDGWEVHKSESTVPIPGYNI